MNEDDNKVVTLKVRVTPEFREKIVNTAKENSRSMNAEIVHRLEQSFNFDDADAKGEITMTEVSSRILTESLSKTISKLVDNLLAAGVEPEAIIEASKISSLIDKKE